MSKAIALRNPISFQLPDDIPNPDNYIDEIANACGDDEVTKAELTVIRALNHEEKVQWLLSLPDFDREIGCLGYVLIVTVYICTMVIIGITAAGDPIKEKKCEEKQVSKCVPKPK